MPMDVLDVTKRFMREPIRILVKKEELTLEGIRHFYIQVEKEVCGSGTPPFSEQRNRLVIMPGIFSLVDKFD